MSPSDPMKVSAGLASRGHGGLGGVQAAALADKKKRAFCIQLLPVWCLFPSHIWGGEQTNRYPEELSLLFHPCCRVNLWQILPGCGVPCELLIRSRQARAAVILSLHGTMREGLRGGNLPTPPTQSPSRGAVPTTPNTPLYTCSRCREHTAEFNLRRF